jgi:hypothetical protein
VFSVNVKQKSKQGGNVVEVVVDVVVVVVAVKTQLLTMVKSPLESVTVAV